MRNRHKFAYKSGGVSEPAYNQAFWGNPWDWEGVKKPDDFTLADLLFSMREASTFPSEKECDSERAFVDFFDGYLHLRGHSDDHESDWDSWITMQKYNAANFQTYFNQYSYSKRAYWILATEPEDELCQMIRKNLRDNSRNYRCTPRFPDMMGINLHIDLTCASLRLCFYLQNEERRIELPSWGLNHWLSHLNMPQGCAKELMLECMATNMNQSYYKDRDSEEMDSLHPEDLRIGQYVSYLMNLIPSAGITHVRMTGWFSAGVFQQELRPYAEKRFAKVIYELPYQYYEYSNNG